MNYQEWRVEYKRDLTLIFNKLIYILKRKNLLYKEYSFDTFCSLIFKKSNE
jgi:hypothetical protein